jgi:S-adenosylmethionine hydrolase
LNSDLTQRNENSILFFIRLAVVKDVEANRVNPETSKPDVSGRSFACDVTIVDEFGFIAKNVAVKKVSNFFHRCLKVRSEK